MTVRAGRSVSIRFQYHVLFSHRVHVRLEKGGGIQDRPNVALCGPDIEVDLCGFVYIW